MHEYLDAINGLFETIGAVATWRNVVAIRRDRSVRGVEWSSMAFFAAWGVWNCVWYPSLHQWFSTLGGAFLVSGNIAWLSHALKYRSPSPQDSALATSAATSAGQHQTELYGQAASSTKSISL